MTVADMARYSATALLTVFIALLITPALAETVDTPQCRSALDDANRLMRNVQARQMQFSRYDPAGNCGLLRDNLDDLVAAREPLDRCLTGDEHTRSLGQIDAAIAQIRAQLIGNCQR
jgi:hypothetical protein